MEIELFQLDGNPQALARINQVLNEVSPDKRTLDDMLKHMHLSFTVEGCSRIATHEIVENDDSYTQQSQRYVTLTKEGFVIPTLPDNLRDEFVRINEKAFALYQKMSELNEEGKGYKHGIPIEDARYILPLATKSNIMVTMPGSEISNFLLDMAEEAYLELSGELYRKIIDKFLDGFPEAGLHLDRCVKVNPPKMHPYNNIDELLFEQIQDKVTLLGQTEHGTIRAGLGASTSTQEKATSEIYTRWEKKSLEYALKRGEKIAGRAISVGHTSVEEHSRSTFGFHLSATAYHQLVRHRLREISRPEFFDLPEDFDYVMPPSIEGSQFETEFRDLVEEQKRFYNKVQGTVYIPSSAYILPNAVKLPIALSLNDRASIHMLADRTCNRAQWEIRELAQQILSIGMQERPSFFREAGPKCTKGKCPEGKSSCGRTMEMRERYGFHGKEV